MDKKFAMMFLLSCSGVLVSLAAIAQIKRADFASPRTGIVQALASEEWPAFVAHRVEGVLAMSDFADSGARDVDMGSGSSFAFDLPRRLDEGDQVALDLRWIEWATMREYRTQVMIPVADLNLQPATDGASSGRLAPAIDFRIFTGHNGYVQVFGPTESWVEYVESHAGERWDSSDRFSGRIYELVWKGCADPSSGLLETQLGTPWMNDILERNPVPDTEDAKRTVDSAEGLPCKPTGGHE